jgi:hypothetical protein
MNLYENIIRLFTILPLDVKLQVKKTIDKIIQDDTCQTSNDVFECSIKEHEIYSLSWF